MLRHILVLPLCILLVACAYQSPPRTDPLADLVGSVKIVDSPTRVITDAKKKSLALIVSTSTETQIKQRKEIDEKHLEGYIKIFSPGSYGAVKSLQDSVGPRKLIDTVVSELLPRFKSVTVVSDLAEFKALGYDVAAVVDIGMEENFSSNIFKESNEFTTDISLIMFDKHVQKIGIANGKATESGEYISVGASLQALSGVGLDRDHEEKRMVPMVEAERKSRTSAFRLLNTSLDQFIQK